MYTSAVNANDARHQELKDLNTKIPLSKSADVIQSAGTHHSLSFSGEEPSQQLIVKKLTSVADTSFSTIADHLEIQSKLEKIRSLLSGPLSDE